MVLTVNGSEGDFLKNLNAVKVDGKNIYAKGVAGSDYYYEAAELSLMDTDLKRTFATGIAGFSHVIDSLSAIKYAKVKACLLYTSPSPRDS